MKRTFTLLSLVAVGCSGVEPSGPDIDPPGQDPSPDAGPGAVLFQTCTSGALPQGLPTVDWNRLTNEVITLATPYHSAQDVLAADDSDTAIAGKFSYGAVSKDLEGERIEVWVDDCAGGYVRLGERTTDSDGRIALPLAAGELPVGEYNLYLRVMGDNSAAFARLRVYPPGTQFIVFDIDATLTTSDTELVDQVITEILAEGTSPDPREGAGDITRLRHEQHRYELIYLTGRPYLLDGLTREWLADLGAPSGTVRLTDSVANAWPSEGQVGAFKAGFLASVLALGFQIHAAYGNATTDIFAYEQAGVASERTFILGDHGGEGGTVDLGEGYTQHIADIQSDPPADQPFER